MGRKEIQLENYRCRNCGWEPTVSRYRIPEYIQQLVFHAAMCKEVPEPSAQEKAEQDAIDGLQYGDGYGGD